MKSFHYKKVRFRYLALVSILALLLAFYYILHNSYKSDIKSYKQSRIEELNISYNAIINLHQRTSLLLHETVINTPITWEILSRANSSDSTIQNQARKDLYQHLKGEYDFLTSFDIRQFHFHLPNNHSFLRFHRPEKYGDDLSDIRYSISETNRQLKPHFGFEEGRIYNGFRYVFPIINDKDQHLGSVEISINFNAVQKELNKLHPKLYAFYIRKAIVDKKVFTSEKRNYCSTNLHDELLRENDLAINTEIEALNRSISKKAYTEINNFESFSTICFYQKAFRIITFLPINNVEQEKSAYIVAYEQDESIKFIFIKYAAIISFSLILLLFIADLLIQLRKNNLQLEESEAKLIESNKTKDKFFSIIAHDIKGPVSSSVELVRLLKDSYQTVSEDKAMRSLTAIFSSLSDTYKLLINLLQWSRTQRGTIDFEPKELNLKEIIDMSIAPLHQLSTNKDIALSANIDSKLKVKADHDMLSTIIRNMVSNAIKFTPHHGSISIKASGEKHKDFATICIQDTGLGIPESKQKNLLDIDKETSTRGTDNESGTGLGLVLCNEFVNYHNGKMWFNSKEHIGTTFYFTIPLA